MKQFIIAFTILAYFLLGIIGDFLLIKNWKREFDTINKTDAQFFLVLVFLGVFTFITGVSYEIARIVNNMIAKVKRFFRGDK